MNKINYLVKSYSDEKYTTLPLSPEIDKEKVTLEDDFLSLMRHLRDKLIENGKPH